MCIFDVSVPTEETSSELTSPKVTHQITCFPCKLKDGSAGWTRAVAIFED